VGGELRPAGRGQEAVRTRRAEMQWRSRTRAQSKAGLRDAGPGPEGSAAHPRDEGKAQRKMPPRRSGAATTGRSKAPASRQSDRHLWPGRAKRGPVELGERM